MSVRIRSISTGLAMLMVVGLLVVACATQPAPTPVPGKAEPAAKSAEPAPDKPAAAPAAAAPKPAAPQMGGTLVYARPSLGPALDPHHPAVPENGAAVEMMGAGLVTKDLTTGDPIPYLAEPWKVSDDGLTYEFKLKKNIKWHDGTPLTAKDFVYTIQRARTNKSPWPAMAYGRISSEQAPDDQTLIIKLSEPNAALLSQLALAVSFFQPIPKQAVESLGDKFATQPVLSGPYKFKEMQTGLKLVLERNADFNWGPAWQPGPSYPQNLEFRVVKEYATMLAGLESGEIDIVDDVQAKDVARLKATGKVQISPRLSPGMDPTIIMNTSKAPWDDVRVRKAVNLAMDRQAMIKVVALGLGLEQKGPIPASGYGYWSGVDKIGYGFDLSQAKALMKEAGYTPGSSGILEKDGKPLKFTMKALDYDPYNKVAQIVKEQLKALGIDADIQLQPRPEALADASAGKYDLLVMMVPGAVPDARATMNSLFHSTRAGTTNIMQVKDPDLDKLLDAALRTIDPAKSMGYAAEAQKMAVEKAYSVPLYQPQRFLGATTRVKGLIVNEKTSYPYPQLQMAYVEGGR